MAVLLFERPDGGEEDPQHSELKLRALDEEKRIPRIYLFLTSHFQSQVPHTGSGDSMPLFLDAGHLVFTLKVRRCKDKKKRN